jgi:hypothetical protein
MAFGRPLTKLNGECFGPAHPRIPGAVDPPPYGYTEAPSGSPALSQAGRVVDRAARNPVPRYIPLLERLSFLKIVTEILQVLQLLSGFGLHCPLPERDVEWRARELLPIQLGEGQFDTLIA